MSEWKLIETAPKDGTVILLATHTGKVADGFWFSNYGGGWVWPYVMTEPKFWMPMIHVPSKNE